MARLGCALCALAVSGSPAAEPNVLMPGERADGWQLLFDGKALEGWRVGDAPGTYEVSSHQLTLRLLARDADGNELHPFRVRDGEIIATGPRAHLYYMGPVASHEFANFEFKTDVKTYANANSGIYFHTQWQPTGWPARGYEVQINNSYNSDPSRTGSLWGIRDNRVVPARDGEWFTVHIKVEGKRVETRVDDKVIVDYTEEPNAKRSEELKGRLIGRGTFALQAHHVGNEVHFRNIKVRRLP